MKNIISLSLIIVLLNSCREIPPTITDVEIPDSERIVLLEELTGASCPNCPKGTKAVEAILAKYPEKVVAVGIHGEFLANPTTKSIYDFRNPAAKDLENWLKPWLGKPAATCNRIDLKDDPDQKFAISNTGKWEALVLNELNKSHQMNLLMKLTYNDVSRSLQIDLTAIPLVDLAGDFNISIFLTESHIIDAQTDASVIVENFEHNHVLMGMATKFDGDFLASNLKANSLIKKTYDYTLPTSTVGLWKPENMEVVAAVHYSSANERNVFQAVKQHIK